MDHLTHEICAHSAANVPVSGNPTLSTNPFFTVAIEYNLEPYEVLTYLGINTETDRTETKVWTWKRFGQTCTVLPDGRKIYIGGEYDDWYRTRFPFCFTVKSVLTYMDCRYDPQFFIFNDVVVYLPQSQSYELYRYPTDVFPPTDNHTATLLGDSIWIVGNCGYPQDRGQVTPIYRLELDTLAIKKVEVSGDNPGWIHEHAAEAKGNNVIKITHEAGVWELDVSQRKWTKTCGT